MQKNRLQNVHAHILLKALLGLSYLGAAGCDGPTQPLPAQQKQTSNSQQSDTADAKAIPIADTQRDTKTLDTEPLEGAQVLITQNFVVSVQQNCPEGHVTCDTATYKGGSKKTGDAITLQGITLHSVCADGVTPCRFLGYIFHNGNIAYKVLESGVLQVIQGDEEVLLEEQGTWQY